MPQRTLYATKGGASRRRAQLVFAGSMPWVRLASLMAGLNAPSFGRAKQSLRQARAPIPELDHGARRKVHAAALAHGRLVQLKAHPQALHPAQRRVGVVNEHASEGWVSLA